MLQAVIWNEQVESDLSSCLPEAGLLFPSQIRLVGKLLPRGTKDVERRPGLNPLVAWETCQIVSAGQFRKKMGKALSHQRRKNTYLPN